MLMGIKHTYDLLSAVGNLRNLPIKPSRIFAFWWNTSFIMPHQLLLINTQGIYKVDVIFINCNQYITFPAIYSRHDADYLNNS